MQFWQTASLPEIVTARWLQRPRNRLLGQGEMRWKKSRSLVAVDRRCQRLYSPAMSHIDSHPPGSFCWIELGTTDQPAAKSFYGSLFGWTPSDMPMGPGDFYTIFQLEGRDAAAGYTLRPDQR